MAKVYYESDANLDAIRERTIAVIGYGNQGRAQALNLRDSGLDRIVIGNIYDQYREQAVSDHFQVTGIREACEEADIILLLLPDEVQPQVYVESVAPGLGAGKTLDFASGFNIAFDHISVPKEVDTIMVAPRMIGASARRLYTQGKGFPAFLDVHQNASGRAWETCLALAKGIGALRTGSMFVTFAQEAWMDLLTEQAILPLVYTVFQMGFEVQVEAGLPAEAVLLELYVSKEPAEIFQAAADLGIFDQMLLHSHTGQFGELTGLLQVDHDEIKRFIRQVLVERIQSGRFAQEWQEEQKNGLQGFHAMREQLSYSPLVSAEKRLRKLLGKDFLEKDGE